MLKLLVVCLAVMTGFFTPAYAHKIKFIQVSDVHLTKNHSQHLEDFVTGVNMKFSDIDFIVFTGDNIDKPKEEDLYLFLKIIKDIKFTTYVLVGNHDLSKKHNLSCDKYMKLVRKKLGTYHSSKSNYVFKKGEIIFITMNGVKDTAPGSHGFYGKKELLWLDKMLSEYPDKKVVILQHFPILDTPIKSHSLYKKERYLKVLKKHNNVIAIISGHYHHDREEVCDDINHIVTKNFSNNRYYKLIKIENGFVHTKLIDNRHSAQETL